MKIVASVTLLTLCSLCGIAQKWEPSKIVLTNGDTLRGKVILKYDNFRFMKDGQATILEYGPKDVKLIYLDDELYASSYFMGLSPGELAALPEPFFAKVLLKGDVNLYFHTNKSNRNSPTQFFISRKGEPGFQLIKTIIFETINGTQYRKVNEAYRDQLKAFFKDCPSAYVGTKDYYSEKAMLNLVSSYVDCKKSNVEYSGKSEPTRASLNVIVGMNFSSMNVSEAPTVFPTGRYAFISGKSTSIQPLFGLQVALPMDRKERSNVMAEVLYTKFHMNQVSSGNLTALQTADFNTTFERTYLRANIGFRRNVPIKKNLSANWHLGVGFSFVLNISANYVETYVPLGLTQTVVQNTDFSYFYTNRETSVFGGAGLSYKRTGLLLRYESIVGNINNNKEFTTRMGNLYLALTYRLKP